MPAHNHNRRAGYDFHHWRSVRIFASCSVIGVSIRQIFQPAARMRAVISGSSPARRREPIAAYLIEGINSHQSVASAFGRLTDWCIPFLITKGVIDRSVRIGLEPSSADDGHVGMLAQECDSSIDPAELQDAIAIEELRRDRIREIVS